MVDPDELPAPPARRPRRLLKLVLAVAGTVVLVGVPSAVALYLALGRTAGDDLIHMVPAKADIYVTAMLDPSLSQKRNLQSFLQHFPDLRSEQQIRDQVDRGLDSAFKNSGVDYSRDLKPWIGNQVAAVAELGTSPTAAFLVRTTDEAASTRALSHVDWSGRGSTRYHWSSTSHGGVKVSNGTTAEASNDVSWAVFDHTAVFGNAESLVDSIIDTDHARSGANLGTQRAYLDTLAQLPADHVAVAYVNAQAVIAAVKQAVKPVLDSMPSLFGAMWQGLDADRSFGAALSVQSSSISLDTVTLTDPSKLPVAQRHALSAPARPAAALGWVPQDAFGVIAGTGPRSAGMPPAFGLIGLLTVLGQQTSSVQAQASPRLSQPPDFGSANAPQPVPVETLPPDFGAAQSPVVQAPSSPPPNPLDQLGLAGPDSPLAHLSGDSAIAVEPGSGAQPVGGVVVLGLDQSAQFEAFLGGLMAMANDGQPLTTTAHGDAVIHSMHDVGMGYAPSYTVLDGYAVIGSDPRAVARAVDAHNGSAPNVTSSKLYASTIPANATGGLMFVDLQRLMSIVEKNLSGSDRADFDKNVKKDTDPLRTFAVTSSGDTRHQSVHVVLTVGG
jgi:hypothetical protein